MTIKFLQGGWEAAGQFVGAAAGTNAAPSYSFHNKRNSGLYLGTGGDPTITSDTGIVDLKGSAAGATPGIIELYLTPTPLSGTDGVIQMNGGAAAALYNYRIANVQDQVQRRRLPRLYQRRGPVRGDGADLDEGGGRDRIHGAGGRQRHGVQAARPQSRSQATDYGSMIADSAKWTFSKAVELTTSVKVGGGTTLTKVRVFSQSLTPVAVAANTTAEQTFAVAGLTTADKVFVNKPTAQAGLGIVGMRVSAADTLAITFANVTAGSITPTGGETYQIVAIRS